MVKIEVLTGEHEDTLVFAERGGNVLVLNRRLGEKILIGNDITVQVIDIDRGRVRIGIEAPRDIAIDREELRIAKLKGPKNAEGSAGKSQREFGIGTLEGEGSPLADRSG